MKHKIKRIRHFKKRKLGRIRKPRSKIYRVKKIKHKIEKPQKNIKLQKIRPAIPKAPAAPIPVQEKRKIPEHTSETLETNIDKVLHMVDELGSVKVSVVARKFKVNESKIEEWGKILEEHDLIELHYPPFGKPILKVKREKKAPRIKIQAIAQYSPSDEKKISSKAKLGYMGAGLFGFITLLLVSFYKNQNAFPMFAIFSSPSDTQMFLAIILLLIILGALFVLIVRKRRGHG